MLPGREFHVTPIRKYLIYIFQIQDVNALIDKVNYIMNYVSLSLGTPLC